MKKIDLSTLNWQLTGWPPELWRLGYTMEMGSAARPEIAPLPCRVPGSVQATLLEAGIIPDWNVGLDSRASEWVENRHWIYEAELPSVAAGEPARVRFEGLDGVGEVWLDGKKLLDFTNVFLPYEADLGGLLDAQTPHRLQIIFLCPPRWLGQFGFTSQIKDWKPRFNYTWDWIPRIVQTGVFGAVTLEIGKAGALDTAQFYTTCDAEKGEGGIRFDIGTAGEELTATLREGDAEVARVKIPAGATTFSWEHIPVQPWFPTGSSNKVIAKLYTLELTNGAEQRNCSVGFKQIEWKPCEGAAAHIDPWICCINEQDTFLQGVNWTPIRPLFADLKREDYALRLNAYHAMGMNCIRVWGGGFPEHAWLYEICDQLGILVWQDFPLSSSGLDNWPPEDPKVMAEAIEIARCMVQRLRGSVSLLLWCGGNELQGANDGGKIGIGKPAPMSHPLLAGFQVVVEELDPSNRFVETTSSGPCFTAEPENFGKDMHWDVHGPWQADGVKMEPWQDYWKKDDALFRSEMGNPGAQPADLMRRYLGDCDFKDAKLTNPYWHRNAFWFEMDAFLADRKDQPWEIEDYVAWSQERQASKLSFAVATFKARFPRCGGLIIWMGHDSFPCPVNTSLLDYEGRPKPVAVALAKVLK